MRGGKGEKGGRGDLGGAHGGALSRARSADLISGIDLVEIIISWQRKFLQECVNLTRTTHGCIYFSCQKLLKFIDSRRARTSRAADPAQAAFERIWHI